MRVKGAVPSAAAFEGKINTFRHTVAVPISPFALESVNFVSSAATVWRPGSVVCPSPRHSPISAGHWPKTACPRFFAMIASLVEAVMQETTRQSLWQASVIGVAFVLAGVAALWAGLDPSAADALSKFWPTGVIGIGVALILGNGQG
jgi:hypothetical protein